jgi:X-Pro dipeptidyl-peptidase
VLPRRLLCAVTATVLAAFMAPAAFAGQARSAAKPPPLHPRTTDQYKALPLETFSVPTRGGDVFVELIRPNVPAGKRIPIILTYTPYSFLGETADDGMAAEYVPRGYARALAHVVGTGNSGGCWDYGGKRETISSFDLVEYLGTRSWSNGKVGMVGGSYDGTTANMAAATNPPHLTTIVPEVAISAWYGYAYFGGIRYFLMDPIQRQGLIIDEEGFDTPITFDLAGPTPGLSPSPDYVTHLPERICADVLEHTERGYSFEPDYDQFWLDRDYGRLGANLAKKDGHEITMLIQGGWRDYNVKHSESVRQFRSVPVDKPSTGKDEGVPYTMMVMGQGAHGGVDDEIHFDVILHAWFDHWLYGLDTNIERQLPVITKGNDGVVRQDASWPPPGTGSVRLNLRTGGGLTTHAPAAAEVPDAYTDNGLTTESLALSLFGSGQSDEAGVLWYVSAPLRHELRMSGEPHLDLFAQSDMASTHFTPVLFDLGSPVTTTDSICTFLPPQDACTVSRGFLNARYRMGLGHGEDIVPGKRYEANVGFIDNDWVFKTGHRIAVAVMSSNLWWALPDQRRATNTIFHDSDTASALVLPFVGGTKAARAAGL